MKIKDILEDYSIHPNIPVKHLANDIEKVIGQFKNSLKVGICSPSQLIYSYCNYFDDILNSATVSINRLLDSKLSLWCLEALFECCISRDKPFHPLTPPSDLRQYAVENRQEI